MSGANSLSVDVTGYSTVQMIVNIYNSFFEFSIPLAALLTENQACMFGNADWDIEINAKLISGTATFQLHKFTVNGTDQTSRFACDIYAI